MKRRVPLLGLAAVLLLGAVVRGFEYGRSLWLDEAWVANAVRTGTWEGLFFYPHWLQTSPPFFLVVQKFIGEWGGWRAQSWFFGMASIALAFWLGRRIAGEWAGLAAATTVAGSRWAIAFAKDAKQYSGELFFGLALLLAAVEVTEERWERYRRWLPLLAAVAVGFAYPALFYVPGLVVVLWWRGERRWALATLAAAIATAALITVALASRNTSPLLKEAWAHSYPPPLVEIDRWLRFLWAGTRAAVAGNLWPPGLMLVVVALALWTRRWAWVALAAAPFGWAILASAVGVYPYGYERFVFHLLAPMAMWVAIATGALPENARAAMAVGLLAVFGHLDWTPRHRDGMEAALRYLREEKRVTRADLLYVHAVSAETFRYYQGERPVGGEVVFGEAGAPCCPRPVVGEDPKVKMMDPAFFREDFERFVARGTARRMWFLYTHFDVQWRALGRNDEQEHEKLLARRGCRREERREFPNVSLSAYACPL